MSKKETKTVKLPAYLKALANLIDDEARRGCECDDCRGVRSGMELAAAMIRVRATSLEQDRSRCQGGKHDR